MSKMAQSDEIDELVSSVRSLVANEVTGSMRKMPSHDRLVLTPALRVDTAAEDQTAENKSETPVSAVLIPDQTDEVEQPGPKLVTNADEPVSLPADKPQDDTDQPVAANEPQQDESAESVPAMADTAVDPDIAELAALDGAEIPQPDAPAVADVQGDLETRITNDLLAQDIAGQINEAALRDVVLQILREELAGDMGERITRNVRKLVRREINRVLAARDLD